MQFKTGTLTIAIALLTQFTLIASAQDESGFDFRKTKWGMSVAQVKASEKSKYVGTQNMPPYDEVLVYEGDIGNLQAYILYTFKDKKLIRGVYKFKQNHKDPNLLINNYLKLSKSLSKSYGKPIMDKAIWNNKLYENDPLYLGEALVLGHVTFNQFWATPDTNIFLFMHGEESGIQMSLLFSSVKYESLVESKHKSAEEKDF